MAAIGLRIEQLSLDLENPRIEKAASPLDALQRVVDDAPEKLLTLAEDIVDEGSLSPIERMLVCKSGSGKYVAIEGNRRVAALKILNNPHLLSDLKITASLRKKFEQLASKFDPKTVEPIDAFEVSRREDAFKWMDLRHTGENEGRGIVPWTGVARARFRGENPALQVFDFVRKHGALTPEQNSTLDNRFPISTLLRIIESPEVRKALGLTVDENHRLVTNLPKDEILKPLRRIVLDLAERKKRVSDVYTAPQQVEYVRGLPASDKPNLKAKLDATQTLESLIDASASVTSKTATARSKSADTGTRSTVAPKRLKLTIAERKIAKIFDELQHINPNHTPNAGAVLLRVFLELSVDHFLKLKHISLKNANNRDKTLKEKLSDAIEFFVNSEGMKRKDFIGINRAISSDKSPLNVDLLHAYVHSTFVLPKPQDVLDGWNDAQFLFEKIWQ